jgi:hypothetical protein
LMKIANEVLAPISASYNCNCRRHLMLAYPESPNSVPLGRSDPLSVDGDVPRVTHGNDPWRRRRCSDSRSPARSRPRTVYFHNRSSGWRAPNDARWRQHVSPGAGRPELRG